MVGERRRTVYTRLADVLAAPRNPRIHAAGKIADSVTRFGIVELPAVDERTGRLVAGHGRLDDWRTRRDAGQPPPDGIDIDPANGDWLVPVTRGWASRDDAEAEAYLVVSNTTAAASGWDDEGLAQLLADLRDQDPALVGLTGYDDRYIGKHLGDDASPWDLAEPEGALDDEPEPVPTTTMVTCPECGHRMTIGSKDDQRP